MSASVEQPLIEDKPDRPSDKNTEAMDTYIAVNDSKKGSTPLKTDEQSQAVSPKPVLNSNQTVPTGHTAGSSGTTGQTMGYSVGVEQPLIATNPSVVRVMPTTPVFGPYPVLSYCYHCKCHCVTQTRRQFSSMVCYWMIGTFLVTSFCCSCCLSLIPALIEDTYNIEHLCRNCGQIIGVYIRTGC